MVAAPILVFCAGGAAGWFAHGAVRPAPSSTDVVLADLNRAYAFYGARDYPVPFPAERAEELVRWIGRSFAREVRPPNLDEFGYRYRGGRVLPSAGGNVGIFQFERRDDAELAVFFWTTGTPPRLDSDNLTARLWSTDGISFAVVSDKANRDLDTAAAAVSAFYRAASGSD
jgi:anti-sigma factor RsiW